MVLKEYKKGKELTKLEKIKEEIEKLLDNRKYDYNFRYEVSFDITLEIKPISRNKDLLKISNDFRDIEEYLYSNNIKFKVLWWHSLKEIEVSLN